MVWRSTMIAVNNVKVVHTLSICIWISRVYVRTWSGGKTPFSWCEYETARQAFIRNVIVKNRYFSAFSFISLLFCTFIYLFIYLCILRRNWLWHLNASSSGSSYFAYFFHISCSEYRVAISIQTDSRWRLASICVAEQVPPLFLSLYLWGRIHGRLSSECDKWNCVINLASRFNVLRDARRLLSSPCTSIGICQRKCPGESRHPSLPPSLFFFFFFFLLFLLLSSQPCLISGLSYRVVMGASPGRGLAPARAAGGINLLSLKCWKLCKCQTHPSDVLAEGGGGSGEEVGCWEGGLWMSHPLKLVPCYPS